MCFNEIVVEYSDTIDGHHHLGMVVGTSSRELIRRALPLDGDLQLLISAVEESEDLKMRMRCYQQVLENQLPMIYAELQGMAEGAEVAFDTVFLSNYRKEVVPVDDKGCTDLHALGAWGHNEDYSWSVDFRPLTLLKATRVSAEGIRFTWFSVLYPLCLGGMTVGMNSGGVVFTLDNLTPRECKGPECGSISSQVVCRLALECCNIENLISTVSDKRLATGRGFTCSSFSDPNILYIETGPGGVFAIQRNPSGHSNHYIYLDLHQKVSESSAHRLATINALYTNLQTHNDILKGLADTTDGEWPIFRTGKSPDKGYTDFTALIDLHGKEMLLYYKLPWVNGPVIPDKVIKFSSFSA